MRGNRIAGVAVAAAIALAGCGGEDEKPQGVDLTALRCPLAPTGEQVGGVEQYEPAKDSFDTAELIGKRLEDAEAAAAERGCVVIVSIEDGKGLPVAADVDPTRIYVHTEEGVVTEIEGVGGGI
jgi:hypothetical protein